MTSRLEMSSRERFLAALSRLPVDRPAVGTVTSLANLEAMEACGAAFPDVHLNAEGMARLAAYVSVEAGFDIIFPPFSVLHEAAALGAEIDWGARDTMPSIKTPPWKTADDVRVADDFEQHPALAVVTDALKLLRAQYGDRYALVGKAFGPWSLTFHMFGVENVLMMTLDEPDELKEIMARVMEITIRSAQAQIEAGADTLCLADHCSRNMCSPGTYLEFLAPLHREIARRVPAPLVLHACGDTSDRIQHFAETGLACFHYDTVVPAAKARELASDKIALMGGVSNINSLLPADEAQIRADVRRAIAAKIDIIGPECAIPLQTTMRGLSVIREEIETGAVKD